MHTRRRPAPQSAPAEASAARSSAPAASNAALTEQLPATTLAPNASTDSAPPELAGLLAQLQAAYDIPIGPEGELNAATTTWIAEAQLALEVQSPALGTLDDATLRALEDHVRTGEDRWEAVGLVRPEMRARQRGYEGALNTPEATRAQGRWRFDVQMDAARLRPAPSADQATQFAHYAALAALNGVRVTPGAMTQPLVIGLRGLAKDSEQTAQTLMDAKAYRDTFVVLSTDGSVEEIEGATYPSSPVSAFNNDLDGDGVNDSAMIQPGAYDVRARSNWYAATDSPGWNVQQNGSGTLPAWRNRSLTAEGDRPEGGPNTVPRSEQHPGAVLDKQLSSADRAESERQGETAGSIVFHAGNEQGPSSVGCQTMAPEGFARFVSLIEGEQAPATRGYADARAGERPRRAGTAQDFDYVLVDARAFLLAHPDFGAR